MMKPLLLKQIRSQLRVMPKIRPTMFLSPLIRDKNGEVCGIQMVQNLGGSFPMSGGKVRALKDAVIQLSRSVYNPNKKTIFGRKPWNWVTVVAYFLLYNSILIGFTALLLYFASMIITTRDLSSYDSSILGTPGISVYPTISLTSPIIWLNQKKNQKYIEKIQSLLESYDMRNHSSNNNRIFSVRKNLGPCADKPYGYSGNGEPLCVYIMINKVFHWTPQCYNNSLYLPISMPNHLRQYIQTLYSKNPHKKMNYIWLSCVGDQASDKDKIGYLEYYPYPAFDSKLFPYVRQADESPIIAIRFYEIQPGILVTVKCTAYAKNFPNGYSATFQIYLEPKSQRIPEP